MNLSDYQRAKQKELQHQKEYAKAIAVLEHLSTRLKEAGLSSLEQAEKKLKELRTAERKAGEKFDASMEKLDEKWNQKIEEES